MTTAPTGVVAALATPFAADGSVDEARLGLLVDRVVDGGVGGVVAGGSTGEFASLDDAERRRLVEVVVERTAGRAPVVAQTGAMSTAQAVSFSRHAERAGADALMVVAPWYEPLTIAETLTYLRTVAASVTLPVMLYNLPVATGVNLTPDLVRQLATEVNNVRYVKDTTGDFAQAAQLIHHHGDVIDTFVGWDSFALAAAVEGAAGVVAGTANVVPAELSAVFAAVRDGDLDAARPVWHRVYPLIDAMLAAPFAPAVKAALDACSFPLGVPRAPVEALSGPLLDRIATEVRVLLDATVAG